MAARQDLNTLIDAAEALEAAATGAKSAAAAPPKVDAFYTLRFFHHQPEATRSDTQRSSSSDDDIDAVWRRQSGNSSSGGGENSGSDRGELMELRAELRFPPSLSSDPSGSLRGQLRRQLDGLLKRVAGAGGGGEGGRDRQPDATGEAAAAAAAAAGEGIDWEARAMGEGVRVREGETVEDFYGEAFGGGGGRRRQRPAWGAPPRDGIKAERWVTFSCCPLGRRPIGSTGAAREQGIVCTKGYLLYFSSHVERSTPRDQFPQRRTVGIFCFFLADCFHEPVAKHYRYPEGPIRRLLVLPARWHDKKSVFCGTARSNSFCFLFSLRVCAKNTYFLLDFVKSHHRPPSVQALDCGEACVKYLPSFSPPPHLPQSVCVLSCPFQPPLSSDCPLIFRSRPPSRVSRNNIFC